MPILRRVLLALAVSVAMPGCSPLKTFDALVPKDAASIRVAHGVAYGPDARHRLDIYAPRRADVRGDRVPVVVFFYGGSWNSGSRSGYAFVGRALAARGFLTVIPDYRLVPQVHYPAFIEDGAAAVRWTEAHARDYGGDPDRIVVAGHSAGAYIAAMLAFDVRWLGAARRRVRGFAGLAGPYDFAPYALPVTREAFGTAHDPVTLQPVTYAGAGDPPAFLAVGEKDTIVPPANSDALAAKLRESGVPVTLDRYPRVGHVGLVVSIAKPFRGRSRVLDDMTRFIDKTTR